MKRLIVFLSVIITGCSQSIPNHEIETSKQVLNKAGQYTRLSISSRYFDTGCGGLLGRYLYEGEEEIVKLTEAKWTCLNEELYHCPSMSLRKNQDKLQIMDVKAKRSEYSRQDIEACALKMLEAAPTIARPVIGRARILGSAENAESWEQD